MKKVLLFYFPACPYCRIAIKWIQQLQKEHPDLAQVHIEMVDERRQRDRAEQYDYYLVPTFYIDGKKVHEGIVSKEIVRSVLQQAL